MRKQTLLSIIFLCIVLILAYLTYDFLSKSLRTKIYEELKQAQKVGQKLEEKQGEDGEQKQEKNLAQSEEQTTFAQIIPIDFYALKAVNKHVYAWIEISGTDIAYPILQHPKDNSYYLNHTIENIKGLPAAIYTENSDAKDFSSYNTVVYGHNMKNGTMFGALKKYQDKTYLNEHSEIIIYTETQKLVYQIFAAVVHGDGHLAFDYNDTNENSRQKYIDDILQNTHVKSVVAKDANVRANDKLLTLSTCFENQKEQRFLVVAKYIEK